MAHVEQAVVAILAFICLCEGARKINIPEQMQRVRTTRDLSAISRERRGDVMGLGKGEALEPATEMRTATGTTKVKFQETYAGIPIAGATVVFEEDDNGGITTDVSGHLVAGIDDDIPDVTPRLSASEAFTIAALSNHDVPAKAKFDPKKDATLEVYLDESLGETTNARLAYKLSYRVEKQGKLSRPFSIVDANTGDIIKHWEGLSFQKMSRRASKSNRVYSNYDFQTVGGNEKIGKANYDGKSFPKLEITKNDNGSCLLANNVAKVFHCNSSWECEDEAEAPYTFDCTEGLSDSVNGGYSPMADALFYITATYEMFDLWYDVKDPLKQITAEDTESSVCGARIHFGSAFENAFWDGYFITFGDGNNTLYPLTSINVVAHEIAHGITEMNSGLIYQGESGGINEAFSDMAGEAVEFYANSKPDWMIGYEIFKHPDMALRYFDDPKKDGRSIGNYKDYCPGIDVHFSSGVFNRAFYFLGETDGWDVRKAFKPFVVANVLYWMPASKFYSAACDVVRAANDLGFNGDDVTEAFRKVGIEPCVDNSAGVLRTIDITAPAGHEILIEVEVTADMDIDQMTISTYGGRLEISVHTPNCEFCTRKTSFEGKVEICDISNGTYTISLLLKEDMVQGFIVITGGWTNILTNGTLASEEDLFSFEFEMPAHIVQSGQAVITMVMDYGYPVAIVRHGEPPNLDSFEFDFFIAPGSFALICDAKAGTYYATVASWNGPARGINIDVVTILTSKRVDTPPVVTRLPPITQIPDETGSGNRSGSGSGSGNDAEGGDDDSYYDY